MIGAALKHLERSEEKDVPELAPIYEDLAMHYQRRLASLMRRERNSGEISLQQDQIYRNLAQTLRKIEYATAIELRDKNQINDEVLRTLQLDLDFLEAQAGSS